MRMNFKKVILFAIGFLFMINYSFNAFADTLDKQLTLQNSDYEAKRSGNATMSRLQLVKVPKGTFYKWMALRGKVGGQTKVPRLCNTDEYVKELEALR